MDDDVDVNGRGLFAPEPECSSRDVESAIEREMLLMRYRRQCELELQLVELEGLVGL